MMIILFAITNIFVFVIVNRRKHWLTGELRQQQQQPRQQTRRVITRQHSSRRIAEINRAYEQQLQNPDSGDDVLQRTVHQLEVLHLQHRRI